jgi:hypothetical protein
MHQRVSTYAALFLVLTSFATIACNADSDTITASPTAPSASVAATRFVTFAAEPGIVAAKFHPTPGCVTHAPFDVQVNAIVRSGQDMFVRRFGFDFVDVFGRRTVPLVFPGTIEVNNSVLVPIPLPTTHPIPFPGQVTMSSVAVEAGRFIKAPFSLRFGCGVRARGTLFVSIETEDRRGRIDVSQTHVQIQ